MDPPEEYGVAINFGSPSQINDVIQKNVNLIPKDTNSHNVADTSTPEERVDDVIEETLEEIIEKPVEEIIEETVDEALKNNKDQDVLTQDIEAAIKIKAAEKLAKENKYDLIVYQGVAYASPAIDITDLVIKSLGK